MIHESPVLCLALEDCESSTSVNKTSEYKDEGLKTVGIEVVATDSVTLIRAFIHLPR
jgi:hypothetical protein